MRDQHPAPSRRAIIWGVLRDGLIAGALIAVPIMTFMWATAG